MCGSADDSPGANDLSTYRNSERERARVADLFALMPAGGASALDIGARDGHLSRLLADRFDRVTALDLEKPDVVHARVRCVKGDVTRLSFPDASFEVVLCAEVLEHIPTPQLRLACSEIARVTAKAAVIGVPFRQDIRLGRSLCLACGRRNPPWGHVNSFDVQHLKRLFPTLTLAKLSYVGQFNQQTNALSARLMDYAGNPFGTYEQDEPCIHCGASLVRPPKRHLMQRIATKAAHALNVAQAAFTPIRANWVHARFEKRVT